MLAAVKARKAVQAPGDGDRDYERRHLNGATWRRGGRRSLAEITLEAWKRRSLWERIKERGASLFRHEV